MGTLIQFPSRVRPQRAAKERRDTVPLWALPGMFAFAWTQACSLAVLNSLPYRLPMRGAVDVGEHVVLPWRGPRKRA